MKTKSTATKRNPTKPKMTQAAIADLVGVSRQSLLNWKKSGIDISQGNLPALIEKAAGVTDRLDTDAEIKAARLRVLTAQAEKIEWSLKLDRGNYMHNEDVRSVMYAVGSDFKHHLTELENLLPPKLEGKSAPHMAVEIRNHIRHCLLQISKFAETFQLVPFEED